MRSRRALMQKDQVNRPPARRLRIVLVSIHGLIRGHDLELGRDADTGGQTKCVVELARALARSSGVERVDLLTRLVDDPAVSSDYAPPAQDYAPPAQTLFAGDSGNDLAVLGTEIPSVLVGNAEPSIRAAAVSPRARPATRTVSTSPAAAIAG